MIPMETGSIAGRCCMKCSHRTGEELPLFCDHWMQPFVGEASNVCPYFELNTDKWESLYLPARIRKTGGQNTLEDWGLTA